MIAANEDINTYENLRPLQNPTIPATPKKRVDFSEVTGGLRRAQAESEGAVFS